MRWEIACSSVKLYQLFDVEIYLHFWSPIYCLYSVNFIMMLILLIKLISKRMFFVKVSC